MSTDVMDQCPRVDPPYAADEKAMACAFLDWQRDTLICKVSGLSEAEGRRPLAPSGLTLLGLIKHLTLVELVWFRERFAGAPITPELAVHPWAEYWRARPDETSDTIIARYREEIAHSRAITAAHAFDDRARNADPARHPDLTLRWIVLHMIEETARHNGHADLIREAIDGQVGE